MFAKTSRTEKKVVFFSTLDDVGPVPSQGHHATAVKISRMNAVYARVGVVHVTTTAAVMDGRNGRTRVVILCSQEEQHPHYCETPEELCAPHSTTDFH